MQRPMWEGDTGRKPNACDCATRIQDPAVAETLYSRGFRYIGRYLTNVEMEGSRDKRLTPEEVEVLINAGLHIFPIFQETAALFPVPADFTKERGELDAAKAVKAAAFLEFDENTVLYFAVDCDMMENDIKNYAIPYFEGIARIMEQNGNPYRIGVYGSRNTCIKITELLPGTLSFVSNMSTGYSGNLGYVMPEQWAFEQYKEVEDYLTAGTAFDLDFDMASGRDSGVSLENMGRYEPPYNPDIAEEAVVSVPILELMDAFRWLEERFYDYYNYTEPTAEQRIDCCMAVCDYLSQYMYEDYKWEIISPQDNEFVKYMNANFSEHEYAKALYPHIYSYEEGSGNDKEVHRAKLLSDGRLGYFELPHFGIVVKCYIKSRVDPHWSAWAGDFATGIKDVYVNAKNKKYISKAKEVIGEMEPDTAKVFETRMFNYCDFIADLDGYAVRELIKDSASFYCFSESIQLYYSDPEKYHKRYKYFKDILGFKNWELGSVYNKIYDYYRDDANTVLRITFCNNADLYPGSAEATSMVLALNIMYWAKYTHII